MPRQSAITRSACSSGAVPGSSEGDPPLPPGFCTRRSPQGFGRQNPTRPKSLYITRRCPFPQITGRQWQAEKFQQLSRQPKGSGATGPNSPSPGFANARSSPSWGLAYPQTHQPVDSPTRTLPTHRHIDPRNSACHETHAPHNDLIQSRAPRTRTSRTRTPPARTSLARESPVRTSRTGELT